MTPSTWISRAAVCALFAVACEQSPTAQSPIAPQASAAPVVVPFFDQFTGDNCGIVMTVTFEGTARIQQQGDRYLLVANGTITTSTGLTGTFNRQHLTKGDRIEILRFHDVEASNASGQRVVFAMGMYFHVGADGTHIIDVEKYGGYTCIGF